MPGQRRRVIGSRSKPVVMEAWDTDERQSECICWGTTVDWNSKRFLLHIFLTATSDKYPQLQEQASGGRKERQGQRVGIKTSGGSSQMSHWSDDTFAWDDGARC